ncbi:MAG: CdaR family protein [Erysipelotrichia bacterium]|nr:CdaR family protein [Erysipelotrichia bacterium]
MKEKKTREKKVKNSEEKLEIAQKIAANSQKVARTYATLENAFLYVFRSASDFLTKIFFNKKFSKIFSLILAIILYISVNVSSSDTIGISQSATLNDVKVECVYNEEMYEISGIPETVNVMVSGSMSDITLQKSKTNSYVVADLSGLTEGSYQIRLSPKNFSSDLSVNILDNPTVYVTIKKKITTKYNISYEFINKNLMDSTYNLGETTFNTTEVLIRASQDTIDSIAFVKALIDVTGVTESFTREARIVAYDNNGNIVNCSISPETVMATVNVTSPSKEVPIIVRANGVMSDNLALDQVSLDHSTVTIYASNNVLNLIDAVYVDLNVSNITKNTSISTTLNMPSGVNKMDITKVNMEIIVGEKTSKVINDVKVSYTNLNSNFKVKLIDENDVTMNVLVIGTQSNIDKLTADDITVNIDLSSVTSVGIQQAAISVSGKNTLVEYQIEDGRKYIQIEIAE